MAKTITIRDEVYAKLLVLKGRDESFSELFERLVEGVAPLEVLKRLRGCVEFERKDEMLSELNALRAGHRP